MNEPDDDELRRIAFAILDYAQRLPSGPGAACHPEWPQRLARAAWSLGARHDGRGGELHGPVRQLGGES